MLSSLFLSLFLHIQSRRLNSCSSPLLWRRSASVTDDGRQGGVSPAGSLLLSTVFWRDDHYLDPKSMPTNALLGSFWMFWATSLHTVSDPSRSIRPASRKYQTRESEGVQLTDAGRPAIAPAPSFQEPIGTP